MIGSMFRKAWYSDSATLNLDFTTGVLDSRLTFTRSSTGTYIDSSGYVASASIDSPRFDHDPTTLAPRGLLIEGSASTLNQYSEDFSNAYWQKINTTISTTSVTCPDNIGRTTVRVVDNATNASHSIRRGIATTAGTTYTLSFFVRKGSTDTFAAQCFWSSSYQFTLTVSSIDNNTQSITSASGVNATATRVAYSAFGSSPWYRYSITFTHPSAVGAATPDFNFCPINNVGSYVGSGNHTDFFGIQLEAGSGASSYIPTGASTATRAVDYCTMPTSSFITGNPYPNTLFVDCIPATANNGFPDIARLFDQTGGGTFSHGNEIYYYSAATMNVNRKVTASTNTDRTLQNGLAYNTRHKFATAIDSSSFIGSRDGGTDSGAATAPAALASVITHLGVGNSGGSTAINVMNGCIRQIKFWPTALPQATLNALTTL
jgi:hypothetical protein